MAFAQLLQETFDRRAIGESYAASKATGVSQAQLNRYLAGSGAPEWESMGKIARRLELPFDEAMRLFAELLTTRLLDQTEQAALHLFGATASPQQREALVRALSERGVAVDMRTLDATLEAVARGDDSLADLRGPIAALVVAAVSVNLLQQTIEVEPGLLLGGKAARSRGA